MLSSLSLALALASGQSAEPPPRVREERVVVMSSGGPSRDADSDGFVSREEFMAPAAEAFARLDTNSDGRLSDDERPAVPERIQMRRPGDGERDIEIAAADAGSWSHAPRMAMRHDGGGERRTVVVEANGDGAPRVTINGREVQGDEADVIVRHMEGGPDAPHVFMTRPGPGGPAVADGGEARREIFVRLLGGPGEAGLDKDGDGKVSEEEFLAPVREAFRAMDADRSGALEDGERGPHHD